MAIVTMQDIAACPDFEQFYRLARRLSGLTIGMCDPGGNQAKHIGPSSGLSPFCRAARRLSGVEDRCRECDLRHYNEAARSRRSIRYACHLGLTEFTVPVVVDGELIAMLQCGQVLDRKPTEAVWRDVRRRLIRIVRPGRALPALRRLFFGTRVIPPDTQHDLIALLELIANYMASAQNRLKLQRESPGRQVVERAQSFIRQHLAEPLTLGGVAKASWTSTRSLTRHFQKEAGMAVVQFVHQVRVQRACELLEMTGKSILQVGLECGFGSAKQFSRVFRQFNGSAPGAWRKTAAKSLRKSASASP